MFCKIINGDALRYLKSLENESIDLIVTDPPYFVTQEDWDTQWEMKEEYFYWFGKIFKEMNRVLKNNRGMYIFFSQKYMFEYANRFKPHRMLVWHHTNLAKFTNKMWQYTYDPIFYHIKGEKNELFSPRFGLKENFDVQIFPKPQKWGKYGVRYHHSQKPVKLIELLIKTNSTKESIILDPFLGSGTTLIAARNLGRSAIGVEIDREICSIAKNRVFSQRVIGEDIEYIYEVI